MEKRADRILGSVWLKAAAIVMFVISVITFALSAAGIVALCEYDAYRSEENFRIKKEKFFYRAGKSYAEIAVRKYMYENSGEDTGFDSYLDVYVLDESDWEKEGRNYGALIYDSDGKLLGRPGYGPDEKYFYRQTYDVSVIFGDIRLAYEEIPGETYEERQQAVKERAKELGADFYDTEYDSRGNYGRAVFYRYNRFIGKAEICLCEDPLISDSYTLEKDFLELGYNWRYTLIVLCVLSFAVMLSMFVLLIFAAGRRSRTAGITLGPTDRIPFDLFSAVLIVTIMAGVFLIVDLLEWISENTGLLILPAAAAIAILLLFVLWFMSFAARIKAGKWWENTLIARLFHGIRILFRHIGRLIGYIPVIWKALLFLAVAVLFNGIAAVFLAAQEETGLIFWVIGWILTGGVVVVCAIELHKLSSGARRIAEGRPDAKIDTGRMTPGFRRFAEDLNHIGDGIRRAVDEQMKSERLKTELITNVSHDIKTPLTSIINYVDLLEREGAVSEAGQGYLEVLSRQSARLKKLIEDLIQASKASTGNLETHPAPTDMKVLAEQIAGEYQDRFSAAGLTAVCRSGTEDSAVLADGQLLYRVFDNLMGNICKYAQPGTRVYLDVTGSDGKVRCMFRNISANPLNIPPDELTERFVRGDSSRHTDGSGLGLSIAKSLTELQGGRFAVQIDGDLFKVTVEFDRLQE